MYKCGITISIAYIKYLTNNRHYSYINYLSHTNYIKNIITNSASIDSAIIIVAASNG